MHDAAGGFYSAEDADSAASATDARLAEGAFYLWTTGELQRVLGPDAPLVAYHFDLSADEARTLASRHTVHETAAHFRSDGSGRSGGARLGQATTLSGALGTASAGSGSQDRDGVERPDDFGPLSSRPGVRQS